MITKPLHVDMNEQIECAHTLASKFYTDPAILEVEKARIFRRTWQLVGTLSQSCGEWNGELRTISDPESFFTRGSRRRTYHRRAGQAGDVARVQQRVPAPRRTDCPG